MSEAPLTVGQTVARARAAAGMTLAQVADATRVRAAVVSAIEADDFRPCGGEVYARGHLKSIATAIGLDPAEVAAQYDAQRGAAHAEARVVEPIEQPTRIAYDDAENGLASLAGTLGAPVGVRRGANWSAVMALALVAVLGIALFSFLQRPSSPTASGPGTSPSGPPSPAAASSPAATAPSTTAPSSSAPAPSSSDVVAAADGVVVVLDTTGRASWVRVTNASGKTLFEGTLNQGQTQTFRDKTQVRLLIGNAGAVTLNVNGHDLGSPGSGGQVVKVAFGPGDPTQTAA